MRAQTQFSEKNMMLVREFDKYVVEHPEFADKIPDNALVVMQIPITNILISSAHLPIHNSALRIQN